MNFLKSLLISRKRKINFVCLFRRYACKYSQTREPAAPFNEEEMQKELNCELKKENEHEFYEKLLNYLCADEVHIFNKYRTL